MMQAATGRKAGNGRTSSLKKEGELHHQGY
jgi:hypothetical protein